MPKGHENEEICPEICASGRHWLTENRKTRSGHDALGTQAESYSVQEAIGSD